MSHLQMGQYAFSCHPQEGGMFDFEPLCLSTQSVISLSLKSRFCWLFEGLGFAGTFSCELLEIVLVDGGMSMRLFEDDFVLSLSVYLNTRSCQSATG